MTISINNHSFSSFTPLSGQKEARRPIVIEGEKVSSQNSPRKTEQQQATYARSSAAQPQERIIEARPIKESEQLYGVKSVLPARSPLAAFAAVAQPGLNLGASVDTYA